MVYKRTQMYTVSQKAEPKKDKMTKEEIFLLDELSKQSKRGFYFHFNCLIVPLLPLWTFSRVLGLDIEYHTIRIVVVTMICACMLWFACNEFRISFKGKLRKKSRKAMQELPRPKGATKSGKADKSTLALLKTDRSSDNEACGFALFYNNCNFIALVILFSHIGFQKLYVEDNYVVSMTLAAFIVTVMSSTLRGKK
uniref:Translocon-associated protein subunit gamma n=1 Tax=Lygus hesperus TaxID=30085 RepID=A0A0A9W842_LYGHE